MNPRILEYLAKDRMAGLLAEADQLHRHCVSRFLEAETVSPTPSKGLALARGLEFN